MLRGHVEKAGAIGREQPFIGGHGHEIRLHLLHVERQGTAALRQVQHQRGADVPAALADGHEVEQCAIGPAHIRRRHEARLRPDGGKQCIRQGFVPARVRYFITLYKSKH